MSRRFTTPTERDRHRIATGRTPEEPMQLLRKRYRPDVVRLLFIGESPPAGGTFFYAANSVLFRYTQRAFATPFGDCAGDGQEFLEYFRQSGCYLEDLCLQPVNNVRGSPRRALHREGIAPLAGRLSQLREQPCAIVIVGRSIRRPVCDALQQTGWDGARAFSTVFPAMGHQNRYVRELAEVLESARQAGWIRLDA